MVLTEINCSEYSIKSVTVFQSQRAEVVRVFPLQLKLGQNKVQIKSLPSTIDADSIRVSGLGSTRLCDVTCSANSDKSPCLEDASEVIADLTRRWNALQKEKDVYEKEARILDESSKMLTENYAPPEDINAFLNLFLERNKKNISAIASVEIAMGDLNKQMEEEKSKPRMKKGARANGEVTLVIGAEVDTAIDLRLIYVVSGVTWKPLYELHATTKDGEPISTVMLKYGAHISQDTGEDWTEASLTFSTSDSSTNTTIPDLPSIRLRPNPSSMFYFPLIPLSSSSQGDSLFSKKKSDAPSAFAPSCPSISYGAFKAPPPQPLQPAAPPAPATLFGGPRPSPQLSAQKRCGNPGVGAKSAADLDEEESFVDDFEDVVPVGDGTSTVSIVKDSALVTTYAVQGKSTIPSDGIAHIVSIASLDFDAKVKYVAVPRVVAAVYLQCEVKNRSEYRLLPGPVSIIMDEMFVSRTSISDINAGDIFTCTLGVDPATKITYLRNETRSDTKLVTRAGTFNTTSCTTKICIKNKHAFALTDVFIREALPVVDVVNQELGITKKARVILRKPYGLIDAKADEELGLDGQQFQADVTPAGDWRVKWLNPEDGRLPGGDKDGKFEWFGGLKQGEKVVLEAVWDIRTPENAKWVEVADV